MLLEQQAKYVIDHLIDVHEEIPRMNEGKHNINHTAVVGKPPECVRFGVFSGVNVNIFPFPLIRKAYL